MTRAPKGCPKQPCPNRQPCPVHKATSGWQARPSKWEAPRNWKALRNECFRRYGGMCGLCGLHGTDVDHILGKADGGLDVIENLQLLCRDCHKKKTADDNRNRRNK